MLIQADLPTELWPFAMKNVVYIKNRVPHSTTGSVPFELLRGSKASLTYAKVFGCMAYVLRQPEGRKLEPRASEGVLLEVMDHGIYKVLILRQDDLCSIVKSRHVTFDETCFPGAADLRHVMDDERSGDGTWEESSEYDSSDETLTVESSNGPDLVADVENSLPKYDYGNDDNDEDDEFDDAIDTENSQPLEETAALKKILDMTYHLTSGRLTATLFGSVSFQSAMWPNQLLISKSRRAMNPPSGKHYPPLPRSVSSGPNQLRTSSVHWLSKTLGIPMIIQRRRHCRLMSFSKSNEMQTEMSNASRHELLQAVATRIMVRTSSRLMLRSCISQWFDSSFMSPSAAVCSFHKLTLSLRS